MNSRIAVGFITAAALCGCLPAAGTTPAPQAQPLKPADGPRASIYVDYFGGPYSRQLQTRFRVERAAYVVIGHLGGDGEIRILYPETPRSSGWVAPGKTVSLKAHSATYDMSPHLFSFATAPYRNASAQFDSYDGRGHGYVFIIASRFPIDHRALAMGKGYETVGVDEYETTSDPRYAVRSFAEEIVTGPYTLKYARNANSNGSLFAQMAGCPSRWGLFSYTGGSYSPFDFGYTFFMYPGASLFNGLAFANYYGMGRMCRGTYYADYYRPQWNRYGTGVYVPPPGTPNVPGPVTPQLQRPTRRTLQDGERKPLLVVGRSPINRGNPNSESRTYPRENVTWRPSASRPGYPGAGTEFHGRERWISGSGSGFSEVYRPTHPMDTPRLNTPAPPPPTTTTTTMSSSSSGGETKAERPHPRPQD